MGYLMRQTGEVAVGVSHAAVDSILLKMYNIICKKGMLKV